MCVRVSVRSSSSSNYYIENEAKMTQKEAERNGMSETERESEKE